MAIFRYLSEADHDGVNQLTMINVKDMTGLEVPRLLSILLDYMLKYPELLEFPNGVQNLMTIFYQDIQYDIGLLKKVCETISISFNIIMAKD